MKLQKATRFAIYSLLDLAREPGRQRSAGEIAQRYGISTNHLAKVMRELGRAGLVEAERGVGGGYRFVGNAKRVTLWDVVSLFETPYGDSGSRARRPRSARHSAWCWAKSARSPKRRCARLPSTR